MAGHIEEAVRDGARLLADGRTFAPPSGCEGGFFLGPTVLAGVHPGMRVWREEVFGPVLCLVSCATLAQALDLIHAHPAGNGASLYTRSGAAARFFAREVRAGMVGINLPIPVPAASHSFGGWKDSLFGEQRIYGEEGLRFYTRTKAITARWPEEDAEAASAGSADGREPGPAFAMPSTA